jgi:Tol biopolymer transport system component
LVWKNRQGEVLGSLGEPTDSIGSIALSPDAKRVAVNSASDAVLWIYDVARGIPTRFTFDPGNHREPIWSPDGNVLYFSSDRKGAIDLYRKASNGTGSEEILLEDSSSKAPDSVSSDGKLLLYTRIDDLPTLWVLPLVSSPSGRKTESHVFPQTPSNERRRGQFSPDGTWVVYQSAVSGQIQVYAAPFPGPGGTRQISTGAGFFPLWRKDGREIYYVTPDGQLMATEVAVRNGSLEVGRTQKLFDGIVTTRGRLYDVSADGQKFLVVDDGVTPSAQPLTLLQNWMATLRK